MTEHRYIMLTGTVYYNGKRVTRDEITQYIYAYNERIRNAGEGIIVSVCEDMNRYSPPIMLVVGKLKKGSSSTSKLETITRHNIYAERYGSYQPIPIVDENYLWRFLGLIEDVPAELTEHTYDI